MALMRMYLDEGFGNSRIKHYMVYRHKHRFYWVLDTLAAPVELEMELWCRR